jgi:hypothetical protein
MNIRLPNMMTVLLASSCLLSASMAEAKDVQPLPHHAEVRLHGTPEDVLDKPICPKGGKRVTKHCRDSAHYVRTNESHHQVYRNYIENIGGGYIGIGSDQNFTFIAWAASDFAWIMDYDPFVVAINEIHLILIAASATPEAFVAKWSKEEREQTLALIRQAFFDRDDLDWLIQRFKNNQERLHAWFLRKHTNDTAETSHWLQSDASYQKIHGMVNARRIRVMNGDLLKDVSLKGIAETTRSQGPPVQVVYLSNAEEFWPYTPTYRDNFMRLPLGEQAWILRTASTKKLGKRLGGRYVYFIQTGKDFQASLADPGVTSVQSYFKRAEKTEREGVFTLGLKDL